MNTPSTAHAILARYAAERLMRDPVIDPSLERLADEAMDGGFGHEWCSAFAQVLGVGCERWRELRQAQWAAMAGQPMPVVERRPEYDAELQAILVDQVGA